VGGPLWAVFNLFEVLRVVTQIRIFLFLRKPIRCVARVRAQEPRANYSRFWRARSILARLLDNFFVFYTTQSEFPTKSQSRLRTYNDILWMVLRRKKRAQLRDNQYIAFNLAGIIT